MKLITVEEQYDTDANIAQFNKYSEVKNNNPFQDKLKPDLVDFSRKVAYMDQHGIDMQVISDAGNSAQVLPDAYAVDGSHAQNETLAENISQYPTRFAGLATLPANTPDKAAEELEYAVTKLGMKGGIISVQSTASSWMIQSLTPFLPLLTSWAPPCTCTLASSRMNSAPCCTTVKLTRRRLPA
nr:amidohydrolase family protein [Lacticaseibacillus camelliae]